MARRKYPKLSDFLGLDWQEQDPEEPDSLFDCNFCGGDIKVNEHYYCGYTPDDSVDPGSLVFYACTRCVQAAGVKW